MKDTQLNQRLCPSVCPSLGLLVPRSKSVKSSVSDVFFFLCGKCEVWIEVWCPCPPVRNHIETPRHLLFDLCQCRVTNIKSSRDNGKAIHDESDDTPHLPHHAVKQTNGQTPWKHRRTYEPTSGYIRERPSAGKKRVETWNEGRIDTGAWPRRQDGIERNENHLCIKLQPDLNLRQLNRKEKSCLE